MVCHRVKCICLQRPLCRGVLLGSVILLIVVTYILSKQSWFLASRTNQLTGYGHIQTKMLIASSATAISIPEGTGDIVKPVAAHEDSEPILLNSNGKLNNSSQLNTVGLYNRANATLIPAHKRVTKTPQSARYATVQNVPMTNVLPISCDRVIHADVNEIIKASSYQHNNKYIPIPDMRYVEFASNCETFRRDRQYMTQPVNAEEENFSIAYSIIMYKDVEQFERLLRAIYRPQNYYCVHVDIKSSVEVKNSVNSIVRCFHNVFLASKFIDIQWGGYSVLEPEMICMENLWKYKTWKYFINLTGQEFPLKTNLDIVKILKAFNGANSMEGTVERRNAERTSRIHMGNSMTMQIKPPPPVPITLSKGSVHIAASRAFIDYVLHDERALKFREWVKDTGIPDETFFSSLNHSPQLQVPGAYKGKPETDPVLYPFVARFKNWGVYPFNWPCYGKRVRMICIFGIQDVALLSQRPELFANKFYLDYEHLALSCMEELHYNRTRDEIRGLRHFDVSTYENLDFVKNHV